MLNLGVPFVTVRGLGPLNDEDEEVNPINFFCAFDFMNDGKILPLC